MNANGRELKARTGKLRVRNLFLSELTRPAGGIARQMSGSGGLQAAA